MCCDMYRIVALLYCFTPTVLTQLLRQAWDTGDQFFLGIPLGTISSQKEESADRTVEMYV